MCPYLRERGIEGKKQGGWRVMGEGELTDLKPPAGTDTYILCSVMGPLYK